jgi:DmsE family decaheme c-type cytochrome
MRHVNVVRLLSFIAVLAFGARVARGQTPPVQAGVPKPPAGYAGSAECVQCHRRESAQFAATPKGQLVLEHPRNEHEKLGCETCHGPAKQHVQSGAEERGGLITFGRKSPAPVAVRNATCLSCHQKTARTLWTGSAHEARNVACTDCHTVMHAVSERANLRHETVLATCGTCHAQEKAKQTRFAHMPLGERKIECTSCHNPHGSPTPKLLLASSTNETCYTCHAEKRGPFLWEHAPVAENCATCHDSHGSSHEKMLKASRPRLCQQCHNSSGHPTIPRNAGAAADIQFVLNRQCSNCHFNIHGSNHPSGKAFTR